MISKSDLLYLSSDPIVNTIISAKRCNEIVQQWLEINDKEKALEWLNRGNAHLSEIMDYVMNGRRK